MDMYVMSVVLSLAGQPHGNHINRVVCPAVHLLKNYWTWTHLRWDMTDITDMVDDILDDRSHHLRGYAIGDCLYVQQAGQPDAWIEGKAVHLGDWA